MYKGEFIRELDSWAERHEVGPKALSELEELLGTATTEAHSSAREKYREVVDTCERAVNTIDLINKTLLGSDCIKFDLNDAKFLVAKMREEDKDLQ